MHTIKITQGEEAIIGRAVPTLQTIIYVSGVLDAAKQRAAIEAAESKENTWDAEDEAEVQKKFEAAMRMCDQLIQQDSLLLEQGKSEILRDAFVDGSSVVCNYCQALIKISRWEAHVSLWCPVAGAGPVSDSD